MAILGQLIHSLIDQQPPYDLAWNLQIQELEVENTNKEDRWPWKQQERAVSQSEHEDAAYQREEEATMAGEEPPGNWSQGAHRP